MAFIGQLLINENEFVCVHEDVAERSERSLFGRRRDCVYCSIEMNVKAACKLILDQSLIGV